MPYGNTHTRLVGIIRDVQKKRAFIEFPKYQKKLTVPRLYIHSQMKDTVDQEQELEIETWFLKKNRVIPLMDSNF